VNDGAAGPGRQSRWPLDDDHRLRARVDTELGDQGFSVAITDTAVIGRITALLGAEDVRKRERRLAAIKRGLAEIEVRWKLGDDTHC
jgi:hypothetical protein